MSIGRAKRQDNIQLDGQLRGSILHKATVESQESVERGAVRNDAANHLTHRMELVVQRGNDSKVATASAYCPKQIGILRATLRSKSRTTIFHPADEITKAWKEGVIGELAGFMERLRLTAPYDRA